MSNPKGKHDRRLRLREFNGKENVAEISATNYVAPVWVAVVIDGVFVAMIDWNNRRAVAAFADYANECIRKGIQVMTRPRDAIATKLTTPQVVESAQYWLDQSREEMKTSMSRAVFAVENAHNHTANALVYAMDLIHKMRRTLEEADENMSDSSVETYDKEWGFILGTLTPEAKKRYVED